MTDLFAPSKSGDPLKVVQPLTTSITKINPTGVIGKSAAISRTYYWCRIVSVHDGDTVLMDLDQGLNGHQHEWLRLIDCWAPELSEPGGLDAMRFLSAFCVPGMDFTVETFKAGPRGNEKRSFVRYIADVRFNGTAPDGSNSLSELMVNSGLATSTEQKK